MNDLRICPVCKTTVTDYHAFVVNQSKEPQEYYHTSCYENKYGPTDTKESFNDYKIKQLESQKGLMVKYLNLKVTAEDWHGVQDAASDLRDIQVELDTRKDMKNGR